MKMNDDSDSDSQKSDHPVEINEDEEYESKPVSVKADPKGAKSNANKDMPDDDEYSQDDDGGYDSTPSQMKK